MAVSTKTMRDIVTSALRRSGLVPLDQEPEAAEAAETLTALNGMMTGWKKKGVDTSHTQKMLDDLFPLDDSYERGVTAMLVIEISDENGNAIKPATAQAADDCWKSLLAEFLAVAEAASFDAVLAHMPSQRHFIGV